jgi:hypothetical protein
MKPDAFISAQEFGARIAHDSSSTENMQVGTTSPGLISFRVYGGASSPGAQHDPHALH